MSDIVELINDEGKLEKLIKNADAAMYKAKRKDTDIERN